MPKLTCELVPSNQWGTNLRSVLAPKVWDSLRKACYERAGHRCEICNGVGRTHPVECHETWEYQDGPVWIQKLTGLIALCPSCHKVKHFGFAMSQGKASFHAALKHLADVNQWSMDLAIEYVDRQFQIHAIRSNRSYHIDLSWLDDSARYLSEAEGYVRDKRSKLAQTTLTALASTYRKS